MPSTPPDNLTPVLTDPTPAPGNEDLDDPDTGSNIVVKTLQDKGDEQSLEVD